MSHHVVICHAPPDQAVAEAVCATLEQGGHRCWLGARDAPGEGDAATLDAVRASRLVILVLSAASEGSTVLREAAERAAATGLPLLSFVLDGRAPEPAAPVAHRIAAMRAPLDSHLVYLAAAADRLLDDEPARGRPLTMPPRPMPRAGGRPGWLPIALAGAVGIAAIAAVTIAVD